MYVDVPQGHLDSYGLIIYIHLPLLANNICKSKYVPYQCWIRLFRCDLNQAGPSAFPRCFPAPISLLSDARHQIPYSFSRMCVQFVIAFPISFHLKDIMGWLVPGRSDCLKLHDEPPKPTVASFYFETKLSRLCQPIQACSQSCSHDPETAPQKYQPSEV